MQSSDHIFDLGMKKENPYEKWTMRVNRFLKKQTDINITTHDFRKTAATNLYNQNNDIVMVQKMLGHRSLETTRFYVDVDQADLRNEMSKMMKKHN